ncbi:MAG: tetratricopeptide repeat protein [Iphinoe sp. HA4291-MV1]|jgi:tetratricopeptide (TPR) repeat protein|nr:tetratricopeptide repeat protein [Iphinoe sp. HA4291-MV1]
MFRRRRSEHLPTVSTKLLFSHAHAWYHRGNALEKLERYENAIASYDQAIRIQPSYYETWYDRGLVLDRLGWYWYKESLASFDKAIKIKRDDPDAWYSRGLVLNSLRRYRQAIASYNQALFLNPKFQLAIEERQLIQKRLLKRLLTKLFTSLSLTLFSASMYPAPIPLVYTPNVIAIYLTCIMIQKESHRQEVF